MSRESHPSSGEIFAGEIVEEQSVLDINELSRLCRVERTFIVELVEEGVLTVMSAQPRAAVEPSATDPPQPQWRFAGAALRRARMAVRLQRDLEVNLPGVALILELLEELEALRRQFEGARS